MSISLMEDIRRSQKDPIGINIYYNKNLNIDGKIKNILCGIEEEEIFKAGSWNRNKSNRSNFISRKIRYK